MHGTFIELRYTQAEVYCAIVDKVAFELQKFVQAVTEGY